MKAWKHKDEWKMEGENHTVVVSRHTGYDPDEHRWCVYLYVYPGHPRFDQFNPDGDLWGQPHYECHSYVSLFKVHRRDNGDIGSFQLGWDYNHNGDHRFTEYATKGQAGRVFYDAERLFEDAKE